jgi:hypothetical protein
MERTAHAGPRAREQLVHVVDRQKYHARRSMRRWRRQRAAIPSGMASGIPAFDSLKWMHEGKIENDLVRIELRFYSQIYVEK